MKFFTIKEDIPESKPNEILEVEIIPKTSTIVDITSTHKYKNQTKN